MKELEHLIPLCSAPEASWLGVPDPSLLRSCSLRQPGAARRLPGLRPQRSPACHQRCPL